MDGLDERKASNIFIKEKECNIGDEVAADKVTIISSPGETSNFINEGGDVRRLS